MAAGLRLYSTEDIGGAASFVLVIASCLASRLGWGSGADIGRQRDRLLIQTHHWLGAVARPFLGLQDVFHLGDVFLVEFGHAPHFFPATA